MKDKIIPEAIIYGDSMEALQGHWDREINPDKPICDRLVNRWERLYREKDEPPNPFLITPGECRELGRYLLDQEGLTLISIGSPREPMPYVTMMALGELPETEDKKAYYFCGSRLQVVMHGL